MAAKNNISQSSIHNISQEDQGSDEINRISGSNHPLEDLGNLVVFESQAAGNMTVTSQENS